MLLMLCYVEEVRTADRILRSNELRKASQCAAISQCQRTLICISHEHLLYLELHTVNAENPKGVQSHTLFEELQLYFYGVNVELDAYFPHFCLSGNSTLFTPL